VSRDPVAAPLTAPRGLLINKSIRQTMTHVEKNGINVVTCPQCNNEMARFAPVCEIATPAIATPHKRAPKASADGPGLIQPAFAGACRMQACEVAEV
jgi:hypothetical protein